MLPVSVSHPAASGITALVKHLVPQTHKLQKWALETSESWQRNMVACRLIWRCRAESEWIRSEVASSPGPEGRRPLRALHQQTVVEVRAPWPLHTAQKYSMRSLYKDRLLQRGNALHSLPWGCLCCTRSRALYMIWLCQWWLRGVTSGFTLIQLISQCVHGSAHLWALTRIWPFFSFLCRVPWCSLESTKLVQKHWR